MVPITAPVREERPTYTGPLRKIALSEGVTVKELSDRVEIAVEDPRRAEAARSILGEVAQEVTTFEEAFAASGEEVTRSYRDHEADRAEIEAVLEQLNRDWQNGQERMLDLRFELRDQLTREEWEALYSGD